MIQNASCNVAGGSSTGICVRVLGCYSFPCVVTTFAQMSPVIHYCLIGRGLGGLVPSMRYRCVTALLRQVWPPIPLISAVIVGRSVASATLASAVFLTLPSFQKILKERTGWEGFGAGYENIRVGFYRVSWRF